MLELVAVWCGVSSLFVSLIALAISISAKGRAEFSLKQYDDLMRKIIRDGIRKGK